MKVEAVMPDVESLGEASSSVNTMTSEHKKWLSDLFKPSLKSPTSFVSNDSLFYKLLTEIIGLDDEFMARLELLGYVTPSIIVNRFGL